MVLNVLNLKKMIEKYSLDNNSKILVVGLGNEYVTPDALGPCVISGVNVTRHVLKYAKELSFLGAINNEAIISEEDFKLRGHGDLFGTKQSGDMSFRLADIKKDYNRLENYIDRVITTGNKTAYLRIAEGCSNRCTYCAIPYIRGPLRSRKFEDIIQEAEYLSQKGYEELIIIAQDTTKYGIDLYGKVRLAELLQEISKIEGIKWIRFLYAYPEMITDELINVVAENEKIEIILKLCLQEL